MGLPQTVDSTFEWREVGAQVKIRMERGGGLDRRAMFEIPQAVIDDGHGVVRLMMDAGAVARPSDHSDVTDSRLLGVVVFQVEFAPLPPREPEELRRDDLLSLLDAPAWWLVEAEGQQAPVERGTLRQAVREALAILATDAVLERVYASELGMELSLDEIDELGGRLGLGAG